MATLIVEDGSIVPNSNTYASIAYAREFASEVGLTLPSTDDDLSKVLFKAMVYIESRPFQGHRVGNAQTLQWPRNLVIANDISIPNNVVPENIKKAQVTAASLIGLGTELFDTVSGQFITKEKVGPIETEYSDEYLATVGGLTVFGSIDIYLTPYLNYIGGYKLSPSFGF